MPFLLQPYFGSDSLGHACEALVMNQHHCHSKPIPENVKSKEGLYVCPMHPEIQQDKSGTCSICGMSLELKQPAVASLEENPELNEMSLRLWISLFLSVPVVVLAMAHMAPGLKMISETSWNPWLQFVLTTPVVLWGGWPFFERAWQSIIRLVPNMFTLIAMGTGTAYVYSLAALFFPGSFPESFRAHHIHVSIYFESAAMITVLVLLGQVLELTARSQTRSAIRSLLELVPKVARVIREDGEEENVPLDQIWRGDRLRVPPGEKRWKPFKPRKEKRALNGVETEFLVGRGALDDKGPSALAFAVMKALAKRFQKEYQE